MTPLFAYLLCLSLVAILGGAAAVLEGTERGRRFAERAINWVLR